MVCTNKKQIGIVLYDVSLHFLSVIFRHEHGTLCHENLIIDFEIQNIYYNWYFVSKIVLGIEKNV